MKSPAISLNQLKIYRYLQAVTGWVTNEEIARATGVAWRTTCYQTKALTACGICDQVEVSPGYRYRLSPLAHERNPAHLQRLTYAEEIFHDQLFSTD